jgi:hypothetical protein
MKVKDAANTLESILDRITIGLSDDTRILIREEILEFKRSLPWEPEFAELRTIADEAFDDLGRSINQSVLGRMRQRSKALAKYMETISAVTDRAEKDVDTLRLKLIRSVTESSRAVAEAVKEIKSSIEANDLPAAAQKSEEALDLILKLIEDVSKRT